METIKDIKCIIWDLDNTIWDGTLMESQNVCLRPHIREVLELLDNRGVLHSIASKNNYYDAMMKLKEFEIDHFFLYPEIHWNAKSVSVRNIQTNLNFSLEAFALIDDQQFEREEVNSIYPELLTVDATEYVKLPYHPRFSPRFITGDSKKRRLMYLADIVRNRSEQDYQGPKDEFLSSLGMEFVISEAKEEDLRRVEELTVRTNQLNATGRTYDYDELNEIRVSDNHKLLVCELTDKYGSYGMIGLALIQHEPEYWHIRLVLMSCRVISRGVGTVLLTHIIREAKRMNIRLYADFKPTDRNRMMYVTFKFANFVEYTNEGGYSILQNDLSVVQDFPAHIKVKYT